MKDFTESGFFSPVSQHWFDCHRTDHIEPAPVAIGLWANLAVPAEPRTPTKPQRSSVPLVYTTNATNAFIIMADILPMNTTHSIESSMTLSFPLQG